MSEGTRDLLVRGIAAAKAKDKDQARFYLEWVLRADADRQQKIEAWLWLGEISDDPAEKRDCLENILAHEPANPLARRGLAILNGRLDPAQVIDPDRQPPTPTLPEPPQPAKTRQFICQQCGGKLTFTPDGASLTCAYCNRRLTLYQAIEEGAMVEEQDFAVALATARGHTRPVAMQSFDCRGCGASFVRGPDVLSLTCPYCASAYVVELPQTRQLIPPEGIIPLAITQTEASDTLHRWLVEKGLRAETQTTQPGGLYLPAWTFDIGGEVQWRGQVLERREGGMSWSPQTGAYPLFYNDIVVPASHTLSADLAQEVSHFRIDGLVPYDVSYLADWPAEIYQISVADASLVARQQAWEQARRRVMSADLETGPLKDMTVSSAGIVVESFKLILLPVWVARYRCRSEDYSAVINGQTGNVKGETPRGGLQKWLAGVLGED
jgi:DNA-directed RNA polymerase subunit RPC12/RpoP